MAIASYSLNCRRGFYPEGHGVVEACIASRQSKPLSAIDLTRRGEVVRVGARVVVTRSWLEVQFEIEVVLVSPTCSIVHGHYIYT